MNYDEIYEGAYVVHPDFPGPRPPALHARSAFLAPPQIGVVGQIIGDLSGRPRIARVHFPGGGVYDLSILELQHAEHWFIEHAPESAEYARRT